MKWEYRLISARGYLNEEQLNEFGEDGWELICVIFGKDVKGEGLFHYFKRMKWSMT
jgi:hypothetical protein